jgi:hypothetical protein
LFKNRSALLPRRKFLPSGGGGEKNLFLIIHGKTSVLIGHLKGVNIPLCKASNLNFSAVSNRILET